MPVKTIVCLAHSYKAPHGRCVAGKALLGESCGSGSCGSWIRPVSAREHGELSEVECRYQGGQASQLLDVIDIPILKEKPLRHQTENQEIDRGVWVKSGVFAWTSLREVLDRPPSLWINNESTGAGANDRMTQEEAARVNNSLYLIEPEDFVIEIGTNFRTAKRTVRGGFVYNRAYYSLSVTDPIVLQAFAAKGLGSYRLRDVFLCISLTQPFEYDEKCYKLVAGVLSERSLK